MLPHKHGHLACILLVTFSSLRDADVSCFLCQTQNAPPFGWPGNHGVSERMRLLLPSENNADVIAEFMDSGS